MKVTFLGTGTSQGVPVIACPCPVCQSTDPCDTRLRASVQVEADGKVIVIDTGPDFRQQMLRAGTNKLDAILMTHGHKDHLAGLDDVRAYNYMQKKAMDVYARREVHDIIRQEFSYAFGEERYPGVPDLILHEINNDVFSLDGISITPVEVMHHHLPVLGYRIKDFVYVTDASFIAPEEKKKMIEAKVLVVNALRKQRHYSHFNLDQAVELIRELKPERAYLTHISHAMGIHCEVQKELPDSILLAYDELSIEF